MNDTKTPVEKKPLAVKKLQARPLSVKSNIKAGVVGTSPGISGPRGP
jgi:hypothetical protein